MKKTLKIILFALILFIFVLLTKKSEAATDNRASVTYGDFSSNGVETTITFSQDLPNEISDGVLDGWTISGKTAKKFLQPGSFYICEIFFDSTSSEKVVVTVPNQCEINSTIHLAGLNNSISNVSISSLGEVVNNTDLKIGNEPGKTTYSARIALSHINSNNPNNNDESDDMIPFDLTWDLTVVDSSSETPNQPTRKEATVTYGNPTDDGIEVTITFSKDINPESFSNWTVNGNTLKRVMKPGAVAYIIYGFEDNSVESAIVAVPITLIANESIMDMSHIGNNFSIDNPAIASIENGLLKGLKVGETNLNGTCSMTPSYSGNLSGTQVIDDYTFTWLIKVVANSEDDPNTPTNPNPDIPSNPTNPGSTDPVTDNPGSNDPSPNNPVNDNKNPGANKDNKDPSTSDKNLAKAGEAFIIPIVICIFTAISFIYLKKYKHI